MKKLILTAIAAAGLAGYSYGQGLLTADGSGAAGHVYIGGVLDTGTDINAQLLYSTDGGVTYNNAVTFLLSSGAGAASYNFGPGTVVSAASDITFDADGTFYDATGSTYADTAHGPGTVETFELRGWTGSYSTFAAAQAALAPVGTTASFSVTLGSATSLPYPTLAAMGDLNLVATPEPATFALAGLGIASMLAFRRRK